MLDPRNTEPGLHPVSHGNGLPGTIPEALDRAADIYGDRLAVNFFGEGKSLTFASLRRDVDRLACSLARLGIARGSHVAILLPNRLEFVVIWLAVARLGAVAVPMNVAFTAREINYVLNDSDAAFLFIDQGLLTRWREIESPPVGLDGRRVVVVGDDETGAERYSRYDELMADGRDSFVTSDPAGSGDLINIQYTSGTTGFPKGAMLDHRYWLTIAVANNAVFPPGIRSILSDHPVFYLDPPWKLVYGLIYGATVHFSPRMSSSHFMEWLRHYGIELCYFADPVINKASVGSDRDNSVRLFLGYHYTANMVRQIEERFGAPVREMYGSTETGTTLAVPLNLPDEEILGTCGLPAYGRVCKIVDEEGGIVPAGETGELWVAGGAMFKGYYKRPDINNRVFRDGWYRTGDLFMQTPRGYFKFIGRIKDIIRRSGESVSAAEVEAVIRELPGILEVAVTAVPDTYRDEEVKAWILLENNLNPEALPVNDIVSHCSKWLADFKIPRYFAYVDNLPLTASGKVAKKPLLDGQPLVGIIALVDREETIASC
ncbi:hypothetical protein CWI75_07960 [Kineobactrum sediminis]|uniref:AMP-binding protein n=1 Tax=Kineobactrum sediminis TaxID=1905677 RepID=A0A2N5Y4K1_9GAMM|nr:class I adenylate-forming enzyme family protein [Kineobactrum sediminis]PLW83325.1 hypothetical protein CWI75_07960 [Kineobactrum sediminis]